MKLHELRSILEAAADLPLSVRLPDGRPVPAHFHITEVGHVTRRFIDCGGTIRTTENCLLQTWVGAAADDGHRLTAGKLAKILSLAGSVVADDLPVQVEHEDGLISQYALEDVVASQTGLNFQLAARHTDCLAKETCGAAAEPAEATAGCCGPGCCA